MAGALALIIPLAIGNKMETYLQLAIYGNPPKTGKYNMKTHLLSRETICVKVGGEPAANSISCNLVNMLSIWLGSGRIIYVCCNHVAAILIVIAVNMVAVL